MKRVIFDFEDFKASFKYVHEATVCNRLKANVSWDRLEWLSILRHDKHNGDMFLNMEDMRADYIGAAQD